MRLLKPLPSLVNGVKVITDLGMNNQIPSKRIALFQCFCGNNFIGRVNAVKVGHKTSCGCKKDGHPTHGLSKHPGCYGQYSHDPIESYGAGGRSAYSGQI